MRDKDSSISQNSNNEDIGNAEDDDENVDIKIPNLLERLLKDKHNLKYQDIIKEVRLKMMMIYRYPYERNF